MAKQKVNLMMMMSLSSLRFCWSSRKLEKENVPGAAGGPGACIDGTSTACGVWRGCLCVCMSVYVKGTAEKFKLKQNDMASTDTHFLWLVAAISFNPSNTYTYTNTQRNRANKMCRRRALSSPLSPAPLPLLHFPPLCPITIHQSISSYLIHTLALHFYHTHTDTKCLGSSPPPPLPSPPSSSP